jgi:lysophospholipase L1-like esterase
VLNPNDVILFQGDSITDANRNTDTTAPNQASGLGDGYPRFIASRLLADRPADSLEFLNRGISGHKVPQLAERWDKDALDLKPNILSILIGVNDIWHTLSGGYAGTLEAYEEGYHELLNHTRRALPDVKLVICEPFVLRTGAVTDKWFPEFDGYRRIAREQATIFGAAFVPFQSMFDEAAQEAPPQYWAGDGVHPTLAGHALMAKKWREVVGI